MSESAITDSGEKDPRHERVSRNPFARSAQFVRQVISELRRVVTPTADETRRYVIVVLIFVGVMMLLVTLLDLGFGWGAGKIFGS